MAKKLTQKEKVKGAIKRHYEKTLEFQSLISRKKNPKQGGRDKGVLVFDTLNSEEVQFKYVHSNICSFKATYDIFKDSYDSTAPFLHTTIDSATQANIGILNKLKEAEEHCAETLATVIDNFDAVQGNTVKDKVLKYLNQQSSLKGNDKDWTDFQKSLKNVKTTINKLYNTNLELSGKALENWLTQTSELVKNIEKLQQQINKTFTNGEINAQALQELKTQLEFIQNQARTEGKINKSNFKAKNFEELAIKRGYYSQAGLGYEPAVAYVVGKALNAAPTIITSGKTPKNKVEVFTVGTKVRGGLKVFNGKDKGGNGLTDVRITITNPETNLPEHFGINIKSMDTYKSERVIYPEDIVDDYNAFRDWAHFQEYVYWNGMALLAWHTIDPEGEGEAAIDMALDYAADAILKANNSFLSIVYLLGLPSIFIANGKDDARMMNFKESRQIWETAWKYLPDDKQGGSHRITNCFINLNGKFYWTSEIYEKAINKYKDITKRYAFASPEDIISVRLSQAKHLYNEKSQLQTEDVENENGKIRHVKTKEVTYEELQSTLNWDKLIANKKTWDFLLGKQSKQGRKNAFALSLLYKEVYGR